MIDQMHMLFLSTIKGCKWVHLQNTFLKKVLDIYNLKIEFCSALICVKRDHKSVPSL